MSGTILAVLGLDGLTNGAIYALVALALVLVFSVTRIVFIPQGEFIAFGALTMAILQTGKIPGTVWLLLLLAGWATVLDLIQAQRERWDGIRITHQVVGTLWLPLLAAFVVIVFARTKPNVYVQAAMVIGLITPMGSLLYRLAYRSLANSSVLVLLIVSVGVHFALTGLGLLFFGAEGFRTPSFWDAKFKFDTVMVRGQSLIIFIAAGLLILALFSYFRTLNGKALHATSVNRTGARLMGISAEAAGSRSFTWAALIGALSGLLIGPNTTLYYDSGFLIGLKGFVAAVFAGLMSFPLALAGAVGVGLIESFGSFWASAFKEVIVFTVILPVLLWRSFMDPTDEEH
jgi:branched-chain amino acid transport system permease protein